MTISSEHPFATPAGDRAPLRRLRGRLPSAVSVWTAAAEPVQPGADRPASPGQWAGLTVSSFVVVDGEPGGIVGMVDPDSDLADLVVTTGRVAVSLLSWSHRDVADVHAGLAPSPGGAFRTGRWEATPWGPVLVDAVAWVGGSVVAASTRDIGWSRLLEITVEQVQVLEEAAESREPLVHHRGRYGRV